MRIAIGVGPINEDWEQVAAFVQEAEKLGVDIAWSAETWGHDAATPIAFLAGKTSRIKLGTGVMQAGARSPANVAMTAMSLAALSNDRFVLGLGASGPQVVEGWHGVDYDRPITRLRETVDIVRIITRGERLVYNGKVYTLPREGGEGKALKSGARPRPIPVYLATLSPRSLELTGEIADGWVGTSFTPEHADVFFEPMQRGAHKAGRTLADIDRQAGGAVAFGDDLDKLIAARKAGLAFTLGAMGSPTTNFYNDAYKRAGFDEAAREVRRIWVEGRRDEAVARVPDEMVLQSNLLGTEAMVKDRIRAYRDAGITTLRVQPDGRTLADRIETLGRVIDLVRAVSKETEAAAV
ncbi:MAG: LLM class flavin-dependent oxidoreductase [Dehalococcoidia bacterium]